MQRDVRDLESLPEVRPLREASREVVRELGMLAQTYAPAGVTHSQCHALLELDRAGALTVGELAQRLRLDKSVVSRLGRQLVERKLVRTRSPDDDRRKKVLTLAASGRRLVRRIHRSADARVDEALRMLRPEQRAAVLQGMGLYASALRRARRHAAITVRLIVAADDAAMAHVIRTVMTEHGATGPGFAIHDPEVSAMSRAYDPSATPPAEYWVLDDGGEVLGGAGFAPLAGTDGGTCELRKMYLLPEARGLGLGQRLLEHVLSRASEQGYQRCYLETMATMHRARALYRAAGFSPLEAPEGRTGHFGCDAWYAREL